MGGGGGDVSSGSIVSVILGEKWVGLWMANDWVVLLLLFSIVYGATFWLGL